MTTHAIHWEDLDGDLIDIDYQCSRDCMVSTLRANLVNTPDGGFGIAGEWGQPSSRGSYGPWPGGAETDYDVHCSACTQLLWHGLES